MRDVEIVSCFAFTLLETGDFTVILIQKVWYIYIYIVYIMFDYLFFSHHYIYIYIYTQYPSVPQKTTSEGTMMRAVGMMKCLELCRELKVAWSPSRIPPRKLWTGWLFFLVVFFHLALCCVKCSFMGSFWCWNASSRADYPTKPRGIS